MNDIAARLSETRLFRGQVLPPEVVALWSLVSLEHEQVLWEQHAPATELGILLSGELMVRVGDEEVARILGGEMVGESSAFVRGEVRTGTVAAVGRAELVVVGRPQLAALRSSHSDVYDTLLEQALWELAGRIAETDARISRLTRGDREVPSATRRAALPFERMSGDAVGEPPRLLPVLRQLPVVGEAPEDLLMRIAEVLRPRHVEQGAALFLEGDEGDTLYVLGSGQIAVMRAGVDGKAHVLATLGPGSLFGTGAVLWDGRRSAACVAERDSWVFGLDRGSFRTITGEPGRILREGLLCALRGQLVGADRVLSTLRGRKSWRPFSDDISFDEMLAAAGSVLAWRAAAAAPDRLAGESGYTPVTPSDPSKVRLIEYIRGQIIGADEAIETPYGLTRVTYADYTASGRCLHVFEDFMRDEVMPLYANTHTEASGTGRQTTAYREDARRIVAESVGAGDGDAVIFTGSGATGAIDRMLEILNLRIPPDLDAKWGLAEHVPADARPVVFVGPYEHHSNILPWVHSICDVVVVEDDEEGRVDIADLEKKLVAYAARPLKIGSFSAASNVSGVVTDTAAVAIALHRHGALSFWDYAAAGPYADVAMNQVAPGPDGHLAYKDAAFISPHKFIGGPGTPGLLIVKRNLVRNTVPTQPGGGTVALVTPEKTVYWQHEEHREEGGTPAILESIRCGLAFRLKMSVGVETIEQMEFAMVRRAIDLWSGNPAIRVIGSPRAKRLSIVSIMVRNGNRYVHNNYIVTLLNDLFGIQARGGCSCAGPYMHRLLGVGSQTARAYVEAVEKGFVSLKPGWARVNFNYFISPVEFDYIVQAVDLVASHGWALMGDYDFDLVSGQWHHKAGQPFEPMRLTDVRFDSGRIAYPSRHARLPETALESQLVRGREILVQAVERAPEQQVPRPETSEEYERLRWFVLPGEVLGAAC